MPTYYEILKVEPTATMAEIEAAIEAHYNQWRRLVTHHDPNVVNQANQSLQTLEQIRATLTDPAKRAGYDAGIGLSSKVGGLVDLAALQSISSPLLLHPAQQTPIASTSQSVDSWTCPKCQTVNPPKTRFCSKCGQQLGRDCPSCHKLTKASDPFCAECGVNLEEYIRHQKAEEEELQRQKELKEAEAEKRWLPMALERALGSKGKPEVTSMEISGQYQQVFDILVEALETPTYFGSGFVVQSADNEQGYIVAASRNEDVGLMIQAYIQKTARRERVVVLSCSREYPTLPGVKQKVLADVVAALRRRAAVIRVASVHTNSRYRR